MGKRRRQGADEGAARVDESAFVFTSLRSHLVPLHAGGARAHARLVVGLTAVTRALDIHAQELAVCVMCLDAYPRALVQHLPALASARGVPLVCVRAKDGTGSLELGAAVGVSRTVVALAVRKPSLAAPLAGDEALDGLCAALLAHLAPKRKLAPAAPRDAQTEELSDAEPQEYM